MVFDPYPGLQKICHNYVPGAQMAFLGGSMANPASNIMVPQSDYDVVVIAPKVPYPMSYNGLRHPGDDRSVDLIVRDPATLAFDFESARECNKPVVCHNVANSVTLFDTTGKSDIIRDKAKEIILAGPLPMPPEQYLQAWQKLSRDVVATHMSDDPVLCALMMDELEHRIGKLYLRAQSSWTGSGKLLGRRLSQQPAFKKNLTDITAQQDPLALLGLLPKPEGDENKFHDPLMLLAEQEKSRTLRTRFKISYDTPYRQHSLHHGGKMRKEMATNAMAAKLYAVSKAVDPARIGRPTNEYHYATSRMLIMFAEFNADLHNKNTKKPPLIDKRYDMLLKQSPDMLSAIHEARTGDPGKLHRLADKFIHHLQPEMPGFSVRTSPSNFRADPHAMFGFC